MARRTRRAARLQELEELAEANTAQAGGDTPETVPAVSGNAPVTQDKLAEVLERMMALNLQSQASKEKFRPPEFNGKGHIELFIKQFQIQKVCKYLLSFCGALFNKR